MKLGISQIAWTPDEHSEVLPVLRRHNVKGIELAPTLLFDEPEKQSDSAIHNARRFWTDQGFEIIALQALLFGHPEFALFGDADNRSKMGKYLAQIIRLGGILNAKALVFGSPKNRQRGELTSNAANDVAVPFFREMAQIAADNGTCLCIEPNASAYGCDFINTVSEAIDLVQAVAHPGFGLHVDGGVMAMNGEDYEVTMNMALPLMRHFHISEPFLEKTTDNHIDHALLAQIFNASDYERWQSIEMKSGLGSSNAVTIDECLGFVRQVYGADN